MDRKKIVVIVLTVLATLATLNFIVQVIINNNKKSFENKAITTIATVEDFNDEYVYKLYRKRNSIKNKFGRVVVYNAYVTYEVNGTTYTNIKVKGTNDMEPGCQIEVLYLPNEPQKAKSWADLERNYTPEFLFAGIFLGAMAYLLHIGKLRLNKTRMYDEY